MPGAMRTGRRVQRIKRKMGKRSVTYQSLGSIEAVGSASLTHLTLAGYSQ
jgi:hypothetical protein